MPEKKTAKKTAQTSKGFSAEDRAAAKARAQELREEARASRTRADGERDVRAAIAAMKATDRKLAERFHEIVTSSAPELTPKTWYGMPAYARDDKVVCFFRSAEKFKERYAMFGFQDVANLDKGAMWPVAFA